MQYSLMLVNLHVGQQPDTRWGKSWWALPHEHMSGAGVCHSSICLVPNIVLPEHWIQAEDQCLTSLGKWAEHNPPGASSLISLWLYCPYLKVSKFCRSSSLSSNFSWTWSSFVCRWLFVWRACSRLRASFLLSSLATSRAFCRGSIWKREDPF